MTGRSKASGKEEVRRGERREARRVEWEEQDEAKGVGKARGKGEARREEWKEQDEAKKREQGEGKEGADPREDERHAVSGRVGSR